MAVYVVCVVGLVDRAQLNLHRGSVVVGDFVKLGRNVAGGQMWIARGQRKRLCKRLDIGATNDITGRQGSVGAPDVVDQITGVGFQGARDVSIVQILNRCAWDKRRSGLCRAQECGLIVTKDRAQAAHETRGATVFLEAGVQLVRSCSERSAAGDDPDVGCIDTPVRDIASLRGGRDTTGNEQAKQRTGSRR